MAAEVFRFSGGGRQGRHRAEDFAAGDSRRLDCAGRRVEEDAMARVRNFDHVTLSVRDLATARRFFALLDFREEGAVVIQGPPFDEFLGVPGIVADHVTLVLDGSDPRMEVQLLHYRQPPPVEEPGIRDLHRLGLNHICFAVDDIEAVAAKLAAAGFRPRNRTMDFRHCRLVFIDGPEGVTVELSQRK